MLLYSLVYTKGAKGDSKVNQPYAYTPFSILKCVLYLRQIYPVTCVVAATDGVL